MDKLRLKQGRSASPKVARKLEEAMQRLQVQEGQLAGELGGVVGASGRQRLTVRQGMCIHTALDVQMKML